MKPAKTTTTLADRDPEIGDCLSIRGQIIWVAYAPDPSKDNLTWDCGTTTRDISLTKNSSNRDVHYWSFVRPASGMTLLDGKSLELLELDVSTSAPKFLSVHGQKFQLKEASVRPEPVKMRGGMTAMVPQALWIFVNSDEHETLQFEIMDGVQTVPRLTTVLKPDQITIVETKRKPPRKPWRGAFKGLDSPVSSSWPEKIIYIVIILLLLGFLFYGPPYRH